jgi:putative transposase
MTAAVELAARVGVRAACAALGVPRPSYYRRHAPPPASSARPRPPLALSVGEEQAVLKVLHSERFVDEAPAEVYATLLDEGVYHCSVRTLYRVLERHDEVHERRRQLARPAAVKPELLATAPNQVWSWDITKLLGPVKWTYFYLYVVLDIFSRYVVGWLVAECEAAALARHLIAESCTKQGIAPGQLTVHSDRGPSMTSKAVAQLLADLGVTKTHSRPYTSNDNPFSEALFKTTKYRPQFPDRFGSVGDVVTFGRVFFPWYNTAHRHSGIGFLTPEMVHYGQAPAILAARTTTLGVAFAAHPERFKGRRPVAGEFPTAVWINPPNRPADPITSKTDPHRLPQGNDHDQAKGMGSPETGANVAGPAEPIKSPLPARH